MSGPGLGRGSLPIAGRRWLHWGGGLLALIGIGFVGQRLWEYGGDIQPGSLGYAQWLGILALALAYGVANLLLALAWRDLLSHFMAERSRFWAIRVFGISQIAKYLPGNILHLAGRQAMGMANGVPGWTLAKSMAWELGLLVLAGTLFLVLILPWPEPLSPLIGVIAFLLGTAACFGLLGWWVGRSVATALLWHCAFLLASGVIFLVTLLIIAPLDTLEQATLLPSIIGAFVVAWLAGLITPGAPAGVGVREVVILLLLGAMLPEAELVFAVVLSRVITLLGDTLFFAAASGIPGRMAQRQPRRA